VTQMPSRFDAALQSQTQGYRDMRLGGIDTIANTLYDAAADPLSQKVDLQ